MGDSESRPFVDGTFNGVKASFLVDTGASISVIAHSIFELIPNSSSIPSFRVSPSWRLSAVTENELALVGRYESEVRILGRTFFRPFFVVKGMAKTEVILGYDFIREAQLAISCDHVFFSSALNHRDNLECSVLVANVDFSVPLCSVIRVPVGVRSARGGPVPLGQCFVFGQAHDRLGVWDSLAKVDNQGNLFSVVVNATDFDQIYRRNDLLGFADPVSEAWLDEHVNVEEQVAGIVSQFENEPPDPVRGSVKNSLLAEDKAALLEKLVIKAPPEFFEKYKSLLLDYHDVCSKSSFDLGFTDVVQHKVSLTSEDPIHVRQFWIPFEHCQTIYDWVDELLKKVAIEVSRSCFNSPIFLVPKAGGRGMRAVLDFWQVNSASVPDRYTIVRRFSQQLI